VEGRGVPSKESPKGKKKSLSFRGERERERAGRSWKENRRRETFPPLREKGKALQVGRPYRKTCLSKRGEGSGKGRPQRERPG